MWIVDQFVRWRRFFHDWCMSLVPDNGRSTLNLEENEFTWHLYRLYFRWWQVPLSLVCLALGMVIAISAVTTPLLNLSVYMVAFYGLRLLLGPFLDDLALKNLAVHTVLVLVLIAVRSKIPTVLAVRRILPRLPQLAYREEREFRFGSEKWSTLAIIRANAAFGLVHVIMILVPIGVLPFLSLMGLLMTAIYLLGERQTGSAQLAAYKSAAFHTTYNLTAFSLAGVYVIMFPLLLVVLPINGGWTEFWIALRQVLEGRFF